MIPALSERLRTWDGCLNIRDLGGYPTLTSGVTRTGSILRGDALAHLTPAGQHALLEAGIRTIIDLRSPQELDDAPNPYAQKTWDGSFLHLPLFGNEPVQNSAWISSARDLFDLYRMILDRFPGQIVTVLEAIANAPDGGVLFHCHAGKDRTGLIAAFVLAIADVPDEHIIADYADSATCLASLNGEILSRYQEDSEEYASARRMLIVEPQFMQATLDYLRQHYDGPLGYLSQAGLPVQAQASIKVRLVGR